MSLFQIFSRNAFLNQVSRLGIGVVVAQVIAIGVSPLLTRLYSPDELGAFALFGSLVLLLSLISTGAYDVAITMPKNWQDAFSLAGLSFVLTLLFGLLLFPILVILIFFGKLELSGVFLLLLVPGVLLHSWVNIANTWNLRTEQFNAISNGRVLQSGVMGGVHLLAGTGGLGIAGLLLGHLIGRMGNVIYLLSNQIEDVREGIRIRGMYSLSQTAKQYQKQPRFVLLSSLLSTGAAELPIIMISILFDEVLLGLFGLALRVLLSPVNAVTYAFGNVYFQRISKLTHHLNPLFPTLRNMGGLLLGLGIIPFLMLFFFSEPLFSFAFGADWTESGKIARILTPMLFLSFVFTPASRTMMVLGKEHVMPLFSMLSLCVNFINLLIGGLFFDFYTAVLAMSAGQCLIYGVYIFYTIHIVRTYDRSLSATAE